MNNSINTDKIIKHWIQTSDEDFETMNVLYKNKSYNWALFLGHISTEKILKALYVKKKGNHPPFIHNLYRLAELNEIEIPDDYADWLDKITAFNLNARYDDFKKEFFQICTPEFTSQWIEKIKILRLWIKEML
jgi:HEPN domain-containing protein